MRSLAVIRGGAASALPRGSSGWSAKGLGLGRVDRRQGLGVELGDLFCDGVELGGVRLWWERLGVELDDVAVEEVALDRARVGRERLGVELDGLLRADPPGRERLRSGQGVHSPESGTAARRSPNGTVLAPA
jgi:hypothetical protein